MRRGVRAGVQVRLKGIKVVTKADGKRYVYRRVGARLVPLPDLPENHPDFLAAYHKAAVAPPPPKPAGKSGTVGALVNDFMTSDDWRKALKPGTRRVVRGILLRIAERRGVGPVAGLFARHIEADLEGATPAVHNNRRKAWMMILNYAGSTTKLREEYRPNGNPAREVARRKIRTDGFQAWTAGTKAQFRAYWEIGEPPRLAFEILSWIGARTSDARLLGRQMIGDDGWLTFTQQKTGVDVAIPFTCELPEWALPLKAEHDHLLAALAHAKGLTFILTEYGAPRSERGIGMWFAEKCREAGIEGYTAHGLRKRRGVELAEIEATTHQIMSWLGHMALDEAELYTRSANRKQVLRGTERNQKGGNRGEAVSKTDEKA